MGDIDPIYHYILVTPKNARENLSGTISAIARNVFGCSRAFKRKEETYKKGKRKENILLRSNLLSAISCKSHFPALGSMVPESDLSFENETLALIFVFPAVSFSGKGCLP